MLIYFVFLLRTEGAKALELLAVDRIRRAEVMNLMFVCCLLFAVSCLLCDVIVYTIGCV